ncbi:hypothetical protein [Streptomyces sp. NPDC047990]|uniref:hypothetical protein n=1 Tax=Streptomyces sp. NPDC047990 TaxID=3365496 RepID=UPI003716CA35
MRISRSVLEFGRPLGDGGQGIVREVEKRLINKTWPIAYKEYKPKALSELRVDALERMVAFLPGQPTAVGEWMARNTAWPAALVTEGQSVRGFLMRQIPDEYFLTLPSGHRKTAGFEFLLNSLNYVRRTVGEVSPKQMLGLLLALADTLQRLHDLDVVAGDLSPKNLLFTLGGPRPLCFLIDCDAMGLAGHWALQPVETPGWQLPAGEAVGTQPGDTYKFALLAVRLFLHEQHGQDAGPLRDVAPQVGELAERTLARAPSNRPTLGEWLDPLRRAYDLAPNAWPQPTQTPTVVSTPGPSAGPVPGPGTRGPGGARASGVSTGGSNPYAAPPSANPTPTPIFPMPTYVSPARSSSRLRTGLAVTLAIVLLVVGFIVVRSGVFGGESDGAGTTNDRARSADSRAKQSDALDELLSHNAGRRSSVAASVKDMVNCTDLDSAKRVFTDAARARADLLTALGQLSVDELPDGMTSHLRLAWQSSEKADNAYARVVDEVAGSCTSKAVSGSQAWGDAKDASAVATRAKQDFVEDWNPLAQQYGFSTLAWSDL